jgi:FkbM family methyltransferase
MKTKIKLAIGWLLSLLSLSVISPLRYKFASAPENSFRYRLLSSVFKILKLRKLSNIESFELADHPEIRLVNNESTIVRSLYWYGVKGYEKSGSDWWEKFCRNSAQILEIGANIGYYTVLGAVASGDASYTAVEPHPISAQVLRKNLAENHISKVRVIEAAVVGHKEADQMELMILDEDHDNSPTSAFLVRGGERVDHPASRSVKVPLIEARELAHGIDLIKVDVEGYEYEILSSIKDQIDEFLPNIFVEVRRNTPKLRGLISDLMSTCAYEAYAVGVSKLHKISKDEILSIVLQETYQTRDVLLVRTNYLSSLKP